MSRRQDYYADTISEALITMGVTLTDTQIGEIAEAVAVSRDNESMAFGYDSIQNPLLSEVRRVEDARKADAADAEKRLSSSEKEGARTNRQLQYRIDALERALANARRAA